MYEAILRNSKTGMVNVVLSGADNMEARNAAKRQNSFLSKDEKLYLKYSVRIESSKR